jgi:hypothetical protein
MLQNSSVSLTRFILTPNLEKLNQSNIRRKEMKTATARDDRSGFEAILSQLTPKEGVLGGYLVTSSREEYDRLLRAALHGHTPENVTLGRKGLSLNRVLIIPPDSILCC